MACRRGRRLRRVRCSRRADAREKFGEAAAQGACAVAVDDAHGGLPASAAWSMNLSTRRVASSTVLPMTLISSAAGSSLGCACTVMPRGARARAPGKLVAGLLRWYQFRRCRPSGIFMRMRAGFDFGEATVVAAEHERLLESSHATRGLRKEGSGSTGLRRALRVEHRGRPAMRRACRRRRRRLRRALRAAILPTRRPDCFSIWARRVRSLISAASRGDFALRGASGVASKFFSSSAMRFLWRSTHSVCSARRSASSCASSSRAWRLISSISSRLRCR